MLSLKYTLGKFFKKATMHVYSWLELSTQGNHLQPLLTVLLQDKLENMDSLQIMSMLTDLFVTANLDQILDRHFSFLTIDILAGA